MTLNFSDLSSEQKDKQFESTNYDLKVWINFPKAHYYRISYPEGCMLLYLLTALEWFTACHGHKENI